VSDQNQIIQRASVGDNEPHASEPQAFQSFPFALKIFHGVVFIDVVSPQEAVNLIAGVKAKQSPQIWLIEMAQPVFLRQQG